MILLLGQWQIPLKPGRGYHFKNDVRATVRTLPNIRMAIIKAITLTTFLFILIFLSSANTHQFFHLFADAVGGFSGGSLAVRYRGDIELYLRLGAGGAYDNSAAV